MPMVSWQQTVALAFDIAEDKGATFDGIEDGGRFMSQLSDYWAMNKADLKQMTREQARRDLSGVISAE